jgi:hypothetical protein
MQRKRCFAILGVALTIATATLTLERGAAGDQLDGEPYTAGTYKILHFFKWAKEPSGHLIF